MAELGYFFNAVNVNGTWDREYKAEDFADFFSPLITNGFFPSDLNLKAIADAGNMNVTIKSGRAWINGYMYKNTSDLILTHDVADGVLNRIDRVVVQLSFIDREIKTIIKKGTPASNPLPPTVQRDADIYELGIATVAINAGATSIVQNNIIDTRNDVTVGGIVNNLFAEMNAQARNVKLDDINNLYVSDNVEGALIELGQPKAVYKEDVDQNDKFKKVTLKNSAGVTIAVSVLSNPDSDLNYRTRTETLYGQDGVTPMKTIVYTRTFNSNGLLLNEVPN
ncbi:MULTISPECIES: hypothetical protein [Bacillus]|uniref:hypothetical protein n=1 Tax=Bacillus TaxID=1386 RepID=UPI0002D5E061|nr:MULTISPECIES: hypothetical protein [Bacillus]